MFYGFEPIAGSGHEMTLFHLHVEAEHGSIPRSRTWIVLAGSLFEALSLVPDGVSVKSVEVQRGTVVDPRRLIKPAGSAVLQ